MGRISILLACGLLVAGCATRTPARIIGAGLLAGGAGLVAGGVVTTPRESNLGTLDDQIGSAMMIGYGVSAVVGGMILLIANEARVLESEESPSMISRRGGTQRE